MHDLTQQAKTASADPQECRGTIIALRKLGFCDDAFRVLHHLSDSMERFYSYSKGVTKFQNDGNNHRVHQRLMYVLLSCPGGGPPQGKSFQALAQEACGEIPRSA